ncbi:glycine cleavage system protein H [Calycomorphotria hydatis]|uniref:Glycine cleavage system H protein n=1 Tax=Calycomorphotria hydatis TaxID=2528027 RepID=A0A517T6P6_9PLAN|nr:glycine cleavage system protein H [Calycomorphotria hydatis]QDT64027.1 Glycine cleavage system H protein [Calycomorphotria hydatis]
MTAEDDLVFHMGQYAARIPRDRVYSRNHLWLQVTGDKYRCGFTSYSVRLLQDVYFLDWSIDPHTAVEPKATIGEIESSKAVSSIYSPEKGTVGEFNDVVLQDPSAINTDNYGNGWLFEFDTNASFLTPEEYLQHLEEGWDRDQRFLKGQVNR